MLCYTPVFATLPKVSDLAAQELSPECILEHHLVKKGNCTITQVLVKWCNLPTEAATWEDFQVVQARFPDAVAWGQATTGDGGDVSSVTREPAGGDGE